MRKHNKSRLSYGQAVARGLREPYVPPVAGAAFANVVWYDDFNYTASRGSGWTDSTTNPFTANGPWQAAKDCNVSNPGAGGYLYTVDPTTDLAVGDQAVNPSISSSKVLCFEALSATLKAGGDVDTYLNRGDGVMTDADVLPANVWVQMWVQFSTATSFPTDMKILYPCRGATHGSCTTMSWLEMFDQANINPTCEDFATDYTTGIFNVNKGDDGHTADYFEYPAGCEGGTLPNRMGTQSANAELPIYNSTTNYIARGQWYLMKFHFDTSGANGTREVWVRKYGSSVWVKTADWRGGTYPSGFVWNIDAANQVGHNWFRLGTSQYTNDCTLYIADFQVATSEANLENGYTDA